MKHVSISLSDAHHAMLALRVSQGDYASVEDYVTALVDAEAQARGQERLEELLMEGLASSLKPWTGETINDLVREARGQL